MARQAAVAAWARARPVGCFVLWHAGLDAAGAGVGLAAVVAGQVRAVRWYGCWPHVSRRAAMYSAAARGRRCGLAGRPALSRVCRVDCLCCDGRRWVLLAGAGVACWAGCDRGERGCSRGHGWSAASGAADSVGGPGPAGPRSRRFSRAGRNRAARSWLAASLAAAGFRGPVSGSPTASGRASPRPPSRTPWPPPP